MNISEDKLKGGIKEGNGKVGKKLQKILRTALQFRKLGLHALRALKKTLLKKRYGASSIRTLKAGETR